MNTDIKTIRKITSFCLALVIASMTLCTASCGKSAEDLTPPEMEYPKLSEKCYNADGELIDEDLYEYDADGCLVSHKYIIYQMNEMGLSGLATEIRREAVGKYEYENGRLTRFIFHEKNFSSGYEEEAVYSYAYDTNGLVKEIEINENGKYTGKTSFLRDGSGKVKRMVYYNESGGFNGMIEHKYDASGRCVEEKETLYLPVRPVRQFNRVRFIGRRIRQTHSSLCIRQRRRTAAEIGY